MLVTIRGRIIGIFVVCLAFICALSVFYWWSVDSIREKLYLSEQFEDLLNNILEARRYEKNFLFYHDAESLQENILYLTKINELTQQLAPDITRVLGKKAFDQFDHSLNSYQQIMEAFQEQGSVASPDAQGEEVRKQGKVLVDFTYDLLKLKRKRIHDALTLSQSLPFGFFGTFFLLLAVVIQLILSKVFKPLALMRQTTGKIAAGDFSPMSYEEEGEDEIAQLINAFNRMAGELESRQEQLVQSRKIAAIGTFTAGIAHELNNPINNIYLTAETLLEDYENLSAPEGKELVLDVLNQAERAGEIVRNLLDFSRSEQPSFTLLNIKDVIERTFKLVKNQIMLAGIRVDINVAQDVAPIKGNSRNLEQVFLNLFINAIQSMPGGGSIRVEVQRHGTEHIRIDVQDSGKGIQSEHLQHIFEPFFTTKGVGRGTGLGLAVTYALVKRHGGYVEVESEVDQGTTFSVYLPISKPSENGVAHHASGDH
jgi:two-component system, NtrC family, sensor kinase